MELASRAGEELPESAYESSAAVSAYIDEKIRAQSGAASYGGGTMGAYGGGIQQAGLRGPLGGDYSLGGQDLPPTAKQINFAVSLAVRNRLGLSYEVLSNRRACSAFIDEQLAKPQQNVSPQQQGIGGTPTRVNGGEAAPPAGGATLFNDADIPF
eukprot:scaffold110456_cov31-Tisochrysis_lutea.AAC.1